MNRILGPLCGAGVLIFRRLILIIIHTFITDTLLRMIYMMVFCFFNIFHHISVYPYKDTKGNIAGCISASFLVGVNLLNLVRAAFEAAEYDPIGPYKDLMAMFHDIELWLVLWIPSLVMGFAILLLLYSVISHFFRSVQRDDTHEI